MSSIRRGGGAVSRKEFEELKERMDVLNEYVNRKIPDTKELQARVSNAETKLQELHDATYVPETTLAREIERLNKYEDDWVKVKGELGSRLDKLEELYVAKASVRREVERLEKMIEKECNHTDNVFDTCSKNHIATGKHLERLEGMVDGWHAWQQAAKEQIEKLIPGAGQLDQLKQDIFQFRQEQIHLAEKVNRDIAERLAKLEEWKKLWKCYCVDADAKIKELLGRMTTAEGNFMEAKNITGEMLNENVKFHQFKELEDKYKELEKWLTTLEDGTKNWYEHLEENMKDGNKARAEDISGLDNRVKSLAHEMSICLNIENEASLISKIQRLEGLTRAHHLIHEDLIPRVKKLESDHITTGAGLVKLVNEAMVANNKLLIERLDKLDERITWLEGRAKGLEEQASYFNDVCTNIENNSSLIHRIQKLQSEQNEIIPRVVTLESKWMTAGQDPPPPDFEERLKMVEQKLAMLHAQLLKYIEQENARELSPQPMQDLMKHIMKQSEDLLKQSGMPPLQQQGPDPVTETLRLLEQKLDRLLAKADELQRSCNRILRDSGENI